MYPFPNVDFRMLSKTNVLALSSRNEADKRKSKRNWLKKVSERETRWRIAERKADEGKGQERAEIKDREEKFAVVALHIMSNKEQTIQPLMR